MAQADYDYKFKIVLLGDAAVGKTSLVKNFTENLTAFSATDFTTTMGCEISNAKVKVAKDKTTLLSIWDIGGGSRFHDIRKTFYRGTMGYLLVFDITRPETFENCIKWMREVKQFTGKAYLPSNILGNKVDLEDLRAVKYKDVNEFAKRYKTTFYRTSALTGEHVNKSFVWLARKIFREIGKK